MGPNPKPLNLTAKFTAKLTTMNNFQRNELSKNTNRPVDHIYKTGIAKLID